MICGENNKTVDIIFMVDVLLVSEGFDKKQVLFSFTNFVKNRFEMFQKHSETKFYSKWTFLSNSAIQGVGLRLETESYFCLWRSLVWFYLNVPTSLLRW